MPLEGSTLLMIALAGLALVVGLVAWWLRPGRHGRRRGPLHSMERDDSVGYFRDFDRGGAGVREEDRARRWGAGQDD